MIDKKDFKLIFIGGYYPEILKEYFRKYTKIGLDYAANNLQEAFFKGLDLHYINYTVVNAPFIGSFPPYFKKIMIPNYYSNDGKVISIAFINISYLKRWDIQRKIKNQILKLCHQTIKRKVLVLYNFSCINIIKEIKEFDSTIKVILLVTDLPEYMVANNTILSKTNNIISRTILKNSIDYSLIDGYILIAEGMIQKLRDNKPYLVLEGIYNADNNNNNNNNNVSKEKLRTILYTGNLGERYGILDLLEAFNRIESPNYRLWIRGNGDCMDQLMEFIQKDSRIKYFEQMERQELLELQKKATILINPAHSHQIFTKYFFPSKTLDYLASRTPTLMSRIDGLPKEYEPYLYFFNDESIEGMKDKIVEICEKNQNELDEFGKNASDFICREKTPYPQIQKVLKFIDYLYSDDIINKNII